VSWWSSAQSSPMNNTTRSNSFEASCSNDADER